MVIVASGITGTGVVAVAAAVF
jgi:hypothetical protein